MKTAKVNDLHLKDYVQHLLNRLAADSDADIDDVLPWADGMQKRFGTGNN